MKKNILQPFYLWEYPHKQNKTKHLIRIMRLTIVFILTAIFNMYAANTHSQTVPVNIPKNDLSVGELINAVENQTNYLFLYNEKDIDLNKKIHVNRKKQPVNEILQQAFSDTEISYSFSEDYISLRKKALSMPSIAQQNKKQITGIVTDETGEPIIGANVIERGTANGVITDIDGKFVLDVPEGTTLQISYIGYITQEVPVRNRVDFKLVLKEDLQALDEVVVVAFGIQKKSNLTAPVAAIDAEKLGTRPVTNMSQTLQGVLPGLNMTMNASAGGNINSSLNINIRGEGTIGNDSNDNPLVLIDGVEGDLNMINPQDVESISVLKDASAASIYGSRAAFGVILITTKQGKEGKLKINYKNNLQIAKPIISPNQMDSYSYVNYMNQAYFNDGQVAFFPEDQVERVKLYQEKALIKDGNTTFDPLWTINPQSNGQYRIRDYWGNTDWLDLLFKDNAFSQEHNLNLSGGKPGLNYYMSANYLDKSGIAEFVDDSYKRYTFMTKVNADCFDWLKMQSITRFSRADFETASAASGTYNMWPYIPIAPLHDPYGNYSHYETLLPIMQGGRYKTQADILTQSLKFVAEPIKNWTITADATYRISTNFNHNDIQEVYAYDGDNKPFLVTYPGKSPGYTEVKEHTDKANFFSSVLNTQYDHSFLGGHDMTLLAGFQYEGFSDRNAEAIQDGIISRDVPTLNTTNGVNDNVTGGYTHWATAGFFARANYAYKGRYLAEFNIRYDGSSRFIDDKTWNWFPSASIGWNIAREKFLSPYSDWVTTLKVRASVGTLGNQNTTNLYPFYVSIPLGTGTGNWLVGGEKTNIASSPGLVSALLTWETIRNVNMGLDFGFLRNRLTGSFDYYHRYTYDMVGPGEEKPNTLGTAVPVVNNANLITKGFEVELSWRDRLKNGLAYGARFVLSDSRTEVTKYPNKNMNTSTFYEGKMLGEIWGYDVVGIAKTQEEMDAHLANTRQTFNSGTKWQVGDLMYLDRNKDGEINSGKGLLSDMGDMRVIGNTTPRYNFGISLDASYKGFDLSLFFNGVMKRDYWTAGRALWGATGGSLWGSAPYGQCLDYFRPEGTADPLGPNMNGYLPSPSYTNKNKQVSTLYLQDASYIKWKNAQLGYTIPPTVTQRLGVSRLNVYLSVENLWTGTKMFETIDPEMLNASANYYPLSSVYSFGLNVTF